MTLDCYLQKGAGKRLPFAQESHGRLVALKLEGFEETASSLPLTALLTFVHRSQVKHSNPFLQQFKK